MFDFFETNLCPLKNQINPIFPLVLPAWRVLYYLSLGVSSSELPLLSPSITTPSAKPSSKPHLLLFLCPSKLVDSVSHDRQNISKIKHMYVYIVYLGMTKHIKEEEKQRKTFTIKEDKVSVAVIVLYKKLRIQVLVLEFTYEGLELIF